MSQNDASAEIRTAACFHVKQAREVRGHWLPEVICVDLMMPGETGLALLEYAKNESTLAHIPFIVISASSDDIFFNEARRLGRTRSCLTVQPNRSDQGDRVGAGRPRCLITAI